MTAVATKGRIRRSDCSGSGLQRVRHGRGFSYLDENSDRIRDPTALERLRALAVPPAWKEVWICPDPLGHLQATGIDAAGRKQYLYHPRWRERRDREKFERMVSFGEALPKLRRRVRKDLEASSEPDREQVLACAVRLLDIGVFRIGSEEYADEEGGVGLATIQKEHVTIDGDEVYFDFRAKSGLRRRQIISDPLSFELLRTLKRRRAGGENLLAFREGRRWHDLRSDEINDHLKSVLGEDFSAKDFRTWNATVMASVSLATAGHDAPTKTARKRAVNQSVRAVAELLGNTPAVARRAYIDPRVFDRYLTGWTIAAALDRIADVDVTDDRVRAKIEAAVVDLLTENKQSAALDRERAGTRRS